MTAAEASNALLQMLGRLLQSKGRRILTRVSPSWSAGRVAAALDGLTATCLLLVSATVEQTLLGSGSGSGSLTFGGASTEQWCLCVWTRAVDIMRAFCRADNQPQLQPQDGVGRR